jgi:hypothetical protein
VAEAHDPPLTLQHFASPNLGILRLPDFHGHFHDFFRSTAVPGPFEHANTGDHRRV